MESFSDWFWYAYLKNEDTLFLKIDPLTATLMESFCQDLSYVNTINGPISKSIKSVLFREMSPWIEND